MISMNIKGDGDCCPGDYNNSPTIWLSEEQCEALGVTTAPTAGAVFMLRARAVAVSVTTTAEDGEQGSAPDVRLTLQLTDMEVSTSAGPSAASVLYGE